jgi:hypothetical protein
MKASFQWLAKKKSFTLMFWRNLVEGMAAETPIILIAFLQFLQAIVGILPGLGLDHFHLNPLQFIIH